MKRTIITLAGIVLCSLAAQAEWMANNLAITNTTGTAQTYQIYEEHAFSLDAAETLVQGSVVVSLLDMGIPADSASFTAVNAPIYTAYIDGIAVDSLLNNPYSLTTASPDTVGMGSAEFGSTVSYGGDMWDIFAGGVNEHMAIQIEFTLSPGDSATVLSRFEVIPEPASFMLIGISASAIAFIRRRFIA